jgi:hypothetical protein
MSFLSKIKKGLGIGTLEAKLNVPGQIAGDSGQIEGDFILTAKSDQQIKEVYVKFEMVRHWEETKRRRDNNGREESYTSHQRKTYELGKYIEQTPFDMKASEIKSIHFVIPFQLVSAQSAAEAVIGEGGVSKVLGAISQLGSALRNERFEYKVKGKVDLIDVAIDPKDSKVIIVM